MKLSRIEINIGELRELHTAACNQGDWERAQLIRQRIIILWDSYHHAAELDAQRSTVNSKVEQAHGEATINP